MNGSEFGTKKIEFSASTCRSSNFLITPENDSLTYVQPSFIPSCMAIQGHLHSDQQRGEDHRSDSKLTKAFVSSFKKCFSNYLKLN